MRAPTQNGSYLRRICHQRNADGVGSESIGLLQDIFGQFGLVEVYDQSVESLLLNAGHGGFGIAGTVHRNLETGQNSPQYVRSRVIARYQKGLQVHNGSWRGLSRQN